MGIGNPSTWLGGLGGNGALSAGSGLGFFTGNVAPFIINVLFFAVIAFSLLFMLIGGIMYITSAGDKEAAKKAKSTITSALIGLIVGISSFIIVSIISRFFDSNIL